MAEIINIYNERVKANVRVDDLTCAPDYVKKIIDNEKKDSNLLIDIKGSSVLEPDGEIAWEEYKFVFALSPGYIRIYWVYKWAKDENVYINKVSVEKEEVDAYFKLLEGVDFYGEYVRNFGTV